VNDTSGAYLGKGRARIRQSIAAQFDGERQAEPSGAIPELFAGFPMNTRIHSMFFRRYISLAN